MTFKKMMKGRLDLVPLPLRGPDSRPEAAIGAALEVCLRSQNGPLAPARLWDVAATLHRCFDSTAEEEAGSEDDKESEAASDADGVDPTANPPVCTAEFTQVTLNPKKILSPKP